MSQMFEYRSYSMDYMWYARSTYKFLVSLPVVSKRITLEMRF
jgi:hypothetical protein